jgi:hypothetical protein
VKALLPLVALTLLASPASAQLAELPTQSRIRVFVPSVSKKPLVGKLDLGIIDSVMIADATGRRAFPLKSVERLDVSGGDSRGAGAMRGARYGFIVGLLYTAAIVAADGANGGAATTNGLPKTVTYGLAGTGGATVLGAVFGSAFPTERWTTVHPKRAPRATRTYY